VPAGIFHHFHHGWIEEIARFLNHGNLPKGSYALAEQLVGNLGPDVLTLHPPDEHSTLRDEPQGGVRVAERRPKTQFHARTEAEKYATKPKSVMVRHSSDHDVIAMVEIVPPGNKSSQRRIHAFVRKAEESLAAGIHLPMVNLFPPAPRDPQGIHRLLWEDRSDGFVHSAAKALTIAVYIGDPIPVTFVEPAGIGDELPEMPLFLTAEVYVPVALEATYQSTWKEVQEYREKELTRSR